MNKLEVLFVHPNASKKVYQGLSKDLSAIEPPIWAALLAQHTRNKGYNTKILDCEAERLTAEESAATIDKMDARLTVFVVYGQQPSASTQNMQGVHDILEILKDSTCYNDRKILLTGLHPSAISRITMKSEKMDFVCQGEGPKTIVGLLKTSNMDEIKELENVPGLWYRESGEIRFTKPAPLIGQQEMQIELPGMAWDLLPMDKYKTSNWHAMSNDNEKEPFRPYIQV